MYVIERHQLRETNYRNKERSRNPISKKNPLIVEKFTTTRHLVINKKGFRGSSNLIYQIYE